MRCTVCDLCDLVTKDISDKFFVNSEFQFVVGDVIGHFICEDYNISTKMICLDHGSVDFQWYIDMFLELRHIKLDRCEIYYSLNDCQMNNKSHVFYLHQLLILRE